MFIQLINSNIIPEKMLQIFYNGKWTQFYPIKHFEYDGEGDTIDNRPLAEFEDEIYGKYVGGVAGYSVWWVNQMVKKSDLREVADT